VTGQSKLVPPGEVQRRFSVPSQQVPPKRFCHKIHVALIFIYFTTDECLSKKKLSVWKIEQESIIWARVTLGDKDADRPWLSCSKVCNWIVCIFWRNNRHYFSCSKSNGIDRRRCDRFSLSYPVQRVDNRANLIEWLLFFTFCLLTGEVFNPGNRW
jgi:hypothetical protein